MAGSVKSTVPLQMGVGLVIIILFGVGFTFSVEIAETMLQIDVGVFKLGKSEARINRYCVLSSAMVTLGK